MRRFEGKVVLITGATSGIGRAAALAFAREGARLVLGARREAEGQAVAAAAQALGAEARFVRTDVAREADVERLVRTAVDGFGRLDIAFNNAGVEEPPTSIVDVRADEVARLLDTNVKGVIFGLKHEVAAMLRTGGGAIVNTTSVLGHVGLAGAPVYVATKHAIEGLTKSVALEVARKKVRVNAVAPAVIDTPMFERSGADPKLRAKLEAMHPVGRVGTAEEVAHAVLFLADPANAFVTGTSLVVDGGVTAM